MVAGWPLVQNVEIKVKLFLQFQKTAAAKDNSEAASGDRVRLIRSASGMMDIGIRVVRGPDWKWQNQDGGEGHLGRFEQY